MWNVLHIVIWYKTLINDYIQHWVLVVISLSKPGWLILSRWNHEISQCSTFGVHKSKAMASLQSQCWIAISDSWDPWLTLSVPSGGFELFCTFLLVCGFMQRYCLLLLRSREREVLVFSRLDTQGIYVPASTNRIRSHDIQALTHSVYFYISIWFLAFGTQWNNLDCNASLFFEILILLPLFACVIPREDLGDGRPLQCYKRCTWRRFTVL